MNSDVESEQFDKRLVVTEAEQSRQVPRVILVSINGRELALAVYIAIDAASNVGEFGNPEESQPGTVLKRIINSQVHAVLEYGSPVLLLGDTLLIGLSEGGIMVELRNGMSVWSEIV